MPKRSRGYVYKTRKDGTKYRSYTKGAMGKRSKHGKAYSRHKKAMPWKKGTDGDIIMGYGSYRKGKGGSRVMGGNPPTIQNTKCGFVVRHREYIGDLNTSVAFTNYSFPLNPGIAATFPWLAALASNFEEWVPRGIVFEFKTTSSDSVVSTNANAALGTVIMATEYNPYNGAFGNKQQMENYEWAKSCKPSLSMIHGVECSKRQNPLPSYYVRTLANPTTQDIRFTDLGSFQIATVGMQSSGAACGELWVSYEIELRKPRIQVGVGGDNDASSNADHIVVYNSTVTTTGVLPATPFGTSTTVPLYPSSSSTLGGVACGGIVTAVSFAAQPTNPTKNNFIGGIPVLAGAGPFVPTGTLGASAANTYYFPPGISKGNFMISYNALYTTGGANWTPLLAGINSTTLDLISTNTLPFQGNLSASTSTSCMMTAFVTVTAANASFSFPGTTGNYATPIYAELFVVQIPTSVVPCCYTDVDAVAALQPSLIPIEENIETLFADIAALPTLGVQMQYVPASFTNAQLKSNGSVVLVAAQGAGTIIMPAFIALKLNYGGTNAFTSGASPALIWGAISVAGIGPGTSGFWEQTSNAIYWTDEWSLETSASVMENAAVSLKVNASLTGNAAGDNTCSIQFYYYVITL